MAPKQSPASANKGRAGSPKMKSPAKKLKADGEQPGRTGEEQEEAEEAGKPTIDEGGDAPASHTRSHDDGAAPVSAARATAAAADANVLPQPTIADIILGDHRDTVALLERFEAVAGSGDALMLEKLTDAIAITIRLHSQASRSRQTAVTQTSLLPPAEFEVLYPVMEKKLGEKGKRAREHSMQEHSRIEEDLLRALEKRKEGGGELTSTMKEITDLFMQHLKEEENELVPQMLRNMSEEEQIELAASFMLAKAKAPLTPQPIAA
ncbi:putative hemerythrin-like protein [Chlorella vulgaris]